LGIAQAGAIRGLWQSKGKTAPFLRTVSSPGLGEAASGTRLSCGIGGSSIRVIVVRIDSPGTISCSPANSIALAALSIPIHSFMAELLARISGPTHSILEKILET
jgi:hypothetical protein